MGPGAAGDPRRGRHRPDRARIERRARYREPADEEPAPLLNAPGAGRGLPGDAADRWGEDYAALFTRPGTRSTTGCTDAEPRLRVPVSGDNSVTESYAFLLEGLTANPAWPEKVLGIDAARRGSSTPAPRGWSSWWRYSAKLVTRSNCTDRTWIRRDARAPQACSASGSGSRRASPRPGLRTSIRALCRLPPARLGPGGRLAQGVGGTIRAPSGSPTARRGPGCGVFGAGGSGSMRTDCSIRYPAAGSISGGWPPN